MIFKNVEEYLVGIGVDVVKQGKRNLSDARKSNGDLYNTLKYELETNDNSFIIKFLMQEYGIYVDKGVKGKTSTYPETVASLSDFQYGSGNFPKGGLTKGIKEWVKEKRFQFRDKKTGRFMSYDSTAFMITRSIYNKGIKATEFLSKPFYRVLKEVPIELAKAFKLDVELGLIKGIKK
tara:strand:- start:3163 stop:3696 length:534 start_codon:yes stop_codon:yes gene_type:complete